MTQNNPSKEVKARKPKGSINWLMLGKDKDPEFRKSVLLFKKSDSDPKENYFSTGFLRKKEGTEKGMVYGFHDDQCGETIDNFTHYALLTEPA